MRVQDIMTSGVEATSPDTTADEAWAIMKREAIHHLVVKEGSRLVGLLSDRDLGGARGGSVRAGRRVAELMTPGVVTVTPTETLRKAANLMRGRTIGSLVVTDARGPIGIITVADLLDVIGRGGARAAVQRRTLNHRVPHRKRHVSAGPW